MSNGEKTARGLRWNAALPISVLTAAALMFGGAPAALAMNAGAGVGPTHVAASSQSVTSARFVASYVRPVRITAYRNCAALQKVYAHGVGKKGAVDKSRGLVKANRVKNFYVSNELYAKNIKLDGDKDGVACEKK
ncbi:MAG: excalibur calcium-binding domain-containing protein [Nakamurella sp.]